MNTTCKDGVEAHQICIRCDMQSQQRTGLREAWKLLLSATPAIKESIIQKRQNLVATVLLQIHCMFLEGLR